MIQTALIGGLVAYVCWVVLRSFQWYRQRGRRDADGVTYSNSAWKAINTKKILLKTPCMMDITEAEFRSYGVTVEIQLAKGEKEGHTSKIIFLLNNRIVGEVLLPEECPICVVQSSQETTPVADRLIKEVFSGGDIDNGAIIH